MMIKLNFIRELLVKVEMGGTAHLWNKNDIKELLNSLAFLLIPSTAITSTDVLLDTSVASGGGRWNNEQTTKYQLTEGRRLFFFLLLLNTIWCIKSNSIKNYNGGRVILLQISG